MSGSSDLSRFDVHEDLPLVKNMSLNTEKWLIHGIHVEMNMMYGQLGLCGIKEVVW